MSSFAVSGTWNVRPGSQAGYRVQEVLLGQNHGRRTDQQDLGVAHHRRHVRVNGSFTVDMASVVSDQSQRNAQFDGRIMDVSQ